MRIRLLPLVVTLLLPAVVSAQVFNPTSGSQSWNLPANWSTGVVPNAVGASATFQEPSAGLTVNLNAAITAGSLNFTNNTGFVVTLANGTGGSLTLDAAGSGPASITLGGTSTTTNNLIISAGLTLADSVTVTNNNTAGTGSATLSFTGAVSGAGGFTKDGAGRVSMTTAAKTYTGATVINQGRLRFTATGAANATSSITVNDGGSLYLDSGTGAFNFGSAVITINGGGVAETGGQGALRNQGSGTSTLANAVVIGGGGATVHVDGGANTLQLNGAVSGTGAITKTGGGTLNFTQAHTNLSGGTTVTNGTISVNAASSLGTGNLTFAQTTGNNTAVTLNNGTQSISNLSSTFTDTIGTQTQTLTLTGTALTINQTTDAAFGVGAVSTLTSVIAGTGSVTKQGSAVLTLSNANTYTGGTTVSAGALVATNATGSATGSGAITVGGTGVLSGGTGAAVGAVSGATTVNSGGTIRGDSGTGTNAFTVGNVTINSGGTLATNLGANGASSSLAVSGSNTLTLASGANLNFTSSGFNSSSSPSTLASLGTGGLVFGGTAVNDGQTIATFTSTGGNDGNVAVDPAFAGSSLNFNLSGFNLASGDQLVLRRTGSNLVLTFSPVPEPAALLAACGLAACGAVAVRRWRTRADVAPAA
jgi:autotransporter-associated beta strand protein